MTVPLVSVVLSTYNRRDDVILAVKSVVAQTWPVDRLEIIVVDDGGGDDTGEQLAALFGDRVRYLWKPNGGVSSARNAGMLAAQGAYIAFLDSDDEYRPTKIEKQVALAESDPSLGLIVTDVERMTPDRILIDVWKRRDMIPHDGPNLAQVLAYPSLVPSSVLIRREVFETTGGFDETLGTAEDLDFHLRVAMSWGIGVIEEPLTRVTHATSGGLSQQSRTYHEYIKVMERFVAEHGDLVGRDVCDRALLDAYTRNARGLMWSGEVAAALRVGLKGARRTRRLEDAPRLKALGMVLAKGLVVWARRAVVGR